MELNIRNFEDYRTFLKAFLLKKQLENPQFSLRAWGRKIGVPPSTLSEILSEKRHFPLETAAQISHSLGLPRQERLYFLILVVTTLTQDLELRALLKQSLQKEFEVVVPLPTENEPISSLSSEKI